MTILRNIAVFVLGAVLLACVWALVFVPAAGLFLLLDADLSAGGAALYDLLIAIALSLGAGLAAVMTGMLASRFRATAALIVWVVAVIALSWDLVGNEFSRVSAGLLASLIRGGAPVAFGGGGRHERAVLCPCLRGRLAIEATGGAAPRAP